MRILTIFDTHINSDTDINDYVKLGHYCVKTKPEVIVHGGDVADLDSLNHVISKRGQYTTEQELKYVENCFRAFQNVIDTYNEKQRKYKKKLYRPRKVLTLGNHDIRKNFTGIEEVFKALKWEVYDYLKPFVIDDIAFVHCVVNNTSDTMAVTAKEVLQNSNCNIVTGHSHRSEYSSGINLVTGKKIWSLKCPCFNRNTPEWAEQSHQKWDRGFTIIDTQSSTFFWKGMFI